MLKKKKKHFSKHLYHYTNLDALLSIIGENTFRATNIRFLSDRQEFVGGLDPLRQAFLSLIQPIEPNGLATYLAKRIEESNLNHEAFNVLSFCTRRNYYYMWDRYAKNNGCCICFDRKKLLNAFNENKIKIPYGSKEIEYPFKPVNESFLKCRYIPSNMLPYEAKLYLNKHNIKYSDGKREPWVLDKPMVLIKTMDNRTKKNLDEAAKKDLGSASIDINGVFVDLISFALCTKIAKTFFSYEKEKEERLVFYPLPNQQIIKQTTIKSFKKEYIEIHLNKHLFLSSIKEIQINPNAKNKAFLVTQISSAIKKIYCDEAIPPPVIRRILHSQKWNKKTICIKNKKRNKNLCQKKVRRGS